MKHTETQQDHTEKGLTFIEAIVVIAVFSIVMIALTSSIRYFYRANAYNIEQSLSVNNARKGIEYMVRDIREATYSDEGSYPIIDVDSTSIYFYSDVDRDNNVERIRYFLEGILLKKGVTESSGDPLTYHDMDEVVSIVSEYVQNENQGVPIFRYYDNTGGEILNYGANITSIAFITVNLIVNINPARLPNEFTLRSSATMRNLKTNL
ncbi:MAG: type II secretion system GspH family protein [Patescibacteria group bacterium]|nr:type II secretion system GspH family protein [Patescibacteria group bacterium]